MYAHICMIYFWLSGVWSSQRLWSTEASAGSTRRVTEASTWPSRGLSPLTHTPRGGLVALPAGRSSGAEE